MTDSNQIKQESGQLSAETHRFNREQFTSACFEKKASSVYLRDLYRLIVNHQQFGSFNEVLSLLLRSASVQFGMQNGAVLTPVSPEVFEVCASSDAENLFPGQHVSLQECGVLAEHKESRFVLSENCSTNATKSDKNPYNLMQTRAYLGINLDMGDKQRGLVCFVSSEVVDTAMDEASMLLLELTAEGIACMMDLQNARAQRKTEDLAIFASGSMKTLDEYQAAADLPEGLGISGKVVEVLKRRIGQSSLSIDHIAEELNLSKRTLQRRLQQQGISFAELRDKVRFHFSIDYLIRQQTSIDRISSTLDFSDRTSFTNAFKRWTGLSPSTFRKVFRDYA
ncbi:helix-turn-helix domain-containing protein [Agaribacterium sp. ZY112]|uniref:helix-turn-helix domain-containing protein n=1 Tax=Agaribacterium sp. ZY112 TaxID=3233574 RepID=UPI003524AC59